MPITPGREQTPVATARAAQHAAHTRLLELAAVLGWASGRLQAAIAGSTQPSAHAAIGLLTQARHRLHTLATDADRPWRHRYLARITVAAVFVALLAAAAAVMTRIGLAKATVWQVAALTAAAPVWMLLRETAGRVVAAAQRCRHRRGLAEGTRDLDRQIAAVGDGAAAVGATLTAVLCIVDDALAGHPDLLARLAAGQEQVTAAATQSPCSAVRATSDWLCRARLLLHDDLAPLLTRAAEQIRAYRSVVGAHEPAILGPTPDAIHDPDDGLDGRPAPRPPATADIQASGIRQPPDKDPATTGAAQQDSRAPHHDEER